MKKHSRTLKLLAFHEAGHAVACYILKKKFSFVSIIPDKQDNTLGKVSYKTLPPQKSLQDVEFNRDCRTTKAIERAVIISLAGGIAESKYAGRNITKSSKADYGNAVSAISHLCSSNEENEAYLNLILIRAKQLFTFSCGENTTYWKAVEVLADRLLEEKIIKYQKARTIIEETLRLKF